MAKRHWYTGLHGAWRSRSSNGQGRERIGPEKLAAPMSVPSKPNIDSMSQAETSAEENQVKTKDISGALETPEFPVEQTALLAYSGNSRQRRKAWRQDARRIIEACRDAGIGTTVGDGKTIHVSDLIGHVCQVREK